MMNRIIGYVEGADIYLVTALILFMLVFIFATIQLFTMKKSSIDRLSMIPFNQANDENNEKEN